MKGDESSPDTIQEPDKEEFERYADQVGTTIQPDWVDELDLGKHAHPRHEEDGLTSIRTAEYDGRQIFIKTTYEIEVDGVPFQGHANVDDEGRIHCHAIPYETYSSAIDFVKHLIDLYPESFPGGAGGSEEEREPKDRYEGDEGGES